MGPLSDGVDMIAVPKPSSEHEKLQDDFARWLIQHNRGKPSIQVYKEIGLENGQRADILKLTYPWDTLDIYEIKARRPDFLHEVTSGKWEGYIDQCHEVIFVTPHDLVGPHEIPGGCRLDYEGSQRGIQAQEMGAR